MTDRLKEHDDDLRDPGRELTLGTGAILGIFLGLALLCGLFYGFGYNMGHKASISAAALAASTGEPLPPAANDTFGGFKSSAASGSGTAAHPATRNEPAASEADSEIPVRVKPEPAKVDRPQPVPTKPDAPKRDASSPRAAAALTDESIARSLAVNGAPRTTAKPLAVVVNPSAPSAGTGAAPSTHAPPASRPVPDAGSPGSQLVPAGSFLVQIAAVSHQEDADLLQNALKARGYAVAQRAQPGDKFIHLQIGPFPSKPAAEAMRQRLIADGYNAFIK